MNNSPSIFDLFLIDIETVPQVAAYAKLPEKIQKLFCDKISKTVPENVDYEEVYKQKAGILAEFGKVVCISTGFFYKDTADRVCLRIKTVYDHDEAKLLSDFIELSDRFNKHKKKIYFGGHNIKEFDLPYLCRRILINGLQLPSYLQWHGAKPWEIHLADTMQWWRFGDYKNYTSLHLLAHALGVPSSKDDIDGSLVQDVYYKQNDLKRIATYCEKDVVVVARLIQRFKNMPIVEDGNIFTAD